MTREEIKKAMRDTKKEVVLKKLHKLLSLVEGYPEYEDCVGYAIEALEQEPILDKIRAEIIEEKDCAYADFERYKVEYLGQDCEDALDSLPQDDFRYGMERAIDIIDKYKAEIESQESEKNE